MSECRSSFEPEYIYKGFVDADSDVKGINEDSH